MTVVPCTLETPVVEGAAAHQSEPSGPPGVTAPFSEPNGTQGAAAHSSEPAGNVGASTPQSGPAGGGGAAAPSPVPADIHADMCSSARAFFDHVYCIGCAIGLQVDTVP